MRCSTWGAASSKPCSSSACAGRSITPMPTIRAIAAASMRAAFIPMTCARSLTWRGSRSPPRRICAPRIRSDFFAVPHGAGRAGARLVRHHGQADGGRIHAQGYRRPGRNLVARSIRAAGGRRGMKVHVAYGYGLFTGGLGAHYGAEAAGLHGHSDVGRPDRAAGAADHRFPARDHHGDAELHAGDPGRVRAPGHRSARRRRCRSASSAPNRGPNAMRAEIERTLRHGRRRHLRPVGGDGPGRRAGMRARPRTGRTSGRIISCPRSSIRRPAQVLPRRRGGRAGVHLADQAGNAGDPLPHARPDAAAAGHGARRCGGSRRITGRSRRHADHARRQCVPHRRSRN